jgi:ribose transport system substrate-binding protein
MAKRISVYVKNGVNPNYRAFLLGAARAGAARGVEIIPRVPAVPDNSDQQIALLKADLEGESGPRPDGVLFNPADDVALIPMMLQLNRARIPAINFINRIAGEFVSFIGGDEFRIGQSAMRYFLKALGQSGSIGIIEGPASAPTARERLRGFHAAVGECPNVSFVASACGHYQRDGGHDAMRRILASPTRIDGVIAANDLMALGALDALDAAGRNMLVMGSNGTVEAAQAIRDGKLLASVDYDGFKMGCIAAEAMLRHLDGETIPHEILMPATIVDAANCAAWLVPVEQRQPPAWEAVVG